VANTVAIAGLVLTPATEVNFKTAAVLYLDVCRLSDTSAAVSYLGTSSYPEAVALTINPGIVVGTPFTLKSAATVATTLSRLTDTTFVAAYESSSLLYARHVTNAAGTLSAGTELPIQANATFLESCQLTATRVIVTGRNATVSNQGYYWLIDNTSGTTIANNVSGSFNSGATSYTFPSKILDNRVLIGYQDNGSSNNGVSYVLDLSTETLKSIAGIAKEAGVESNVIDVVTQGECDFLSGLTPGSYYYSSATGFLSASVGDYEVGVAKSATNLLMLERITKVNADLLKYFDDLFSVKATPSHARALQYGIWTTREVKTSSGTFTVPAGVYYLGIACVGKGGNGGVAVGSPRAVTGGGGGGLAFSLKKVTPGEIIAYTISGNSATCLGATGNPGGNGSGSTSNTAGGVGGTATGGDYNYTGGAGGGASITVSGDISTGGGGAGGGAGGYGAGNYLNVRCGGGGGRVFPDFPSWAPGNGGMLTAYGSNANGYSGGGSPRFSGGDINSISSSSSHQSTGGGMGSGGFYLGTASQGGAYFQAIGIDPSSITRMGLLTTTETFKPNYMWDEANVVAHVGGSTYVLAPFGATCDSNSTQSACAGANGTRASTTLGGGGGGGSGGSGGMLAGSGGNEGTAAAAGYGGGGGGSSQGTGGTGGAAVVVFIY
jgi:hypothetical protein